MNRPCNYDEIEAFLGIFDSAHPSSTRADIEVKWNQWLAEQQEERIEGRG